MLVTAPARIHLHIRNRTCTQSQSHPSIMALSMAQMLWKESLVLLFNHGLLDGMTAVEMLVKING